MPILYRAVTTSPPTDRDFYSRAMKDGPLRSTANEQARRYHEGVSMWETEAIARRMAQKYPAQGSFIAEVEIPDDGSIPFEANPATGHYNVWANPVDLRSGVRSLVQV
jgi:hypothetical protein